MAGWVDRQVDAWFDRRIDRYVDRKLDAFLKGQMPDEDFEQLKVMTRKGQPLDAGRFILPIRPIDRDFFDSRRPNDRIHTERTRLRH